jgi:hypothetical protein
MKTKTVLLISLLIISSQAWCNSISKGFMVKFILVPQTFKVQKKIYPVNDTAFLSKELNTILGSAVNYTMGSTYITNESTGSYHRVFNQETFGYNEVELRKPPTVGLRQLSFTIRFSSKKEVSYTQCPEWKFTCSLDSAYIIQVEGNAGHQLLIVILPNNKPFKENKNINPEPMQTWVKQIAIDRKIDSTLTIHIASDPALVAFCIKSNINNKSAILSQPILLINEGKTYIIIKAQEIEETVDRPLNMVRAWENCVLKIKHGTVERFSFEKPDEPGQVISLKNEVTINDKVGCKIILKVK